MNTLRIAPQTAVLPHRRGAPMAVRGVGLIELMVALTLGLVLSGVIFGMFIASRDTLRTTENLVQLHDDARVAFELLAREIREAGATGCGTTSKVANVLNNPSSAWWANWSSGPLIGYGTTTDGPRPFGSGVADRVRGTEAILIRRGNVSPVLITEHNPASAQFKVNQTNHGFDDGDIVMACDEQSAAIFQVTNSSQTNRTIVHNTGTGTPGNCSKDLGYPTNCSGNRKEKTFSAGGVLSSYSATFWYIGQNPRGGRSLYRMENTTTDEMARNVTALQLAYLTSDRADPPQNASDFVSAGAVTDWDDVIAVRVTVTHQTQESIGTDGSPATRTTHYIVTVRNREYVP